MGRKKFEVGRWKFDPPKADKCLLAYGEFGVHSFRRLDLLYAFTGSKVYPPLAAP
jgi:hypothetical protein